MPKVALITGADRGLGLGLTQRLLASGWTVIAGKFLDWPELDTLQASFPETLIQVSLDVSSDSSVAQAVAEVQSRLDGIDLLICNAAIQRSAEVQSITEDLNFDHMIAEFNTNTLGALRVTNAFFPMLQASSMKRLCYVSSEAGSIAESKRTGWFGYCMSKAALNMAVKNMHNDLSHQGYSFRLYHPGWMRTYMSGAKNQDAHYEPDEAADFALKHFLSAVDESQVRLVDWQGNEMPW